MKVNLNNEYRFPTWGLPHVAESVIAEISEARQCPRDYVVGPVITAIGVAAGCKIKVVDDHTNFLNLFAGSVGESTKTKSKPVDDVFKPLYKIHRQKVSEYNLELARLDAEAAETPRKQEKKTPAPWQLIIKQSTPEARIEAYKANPHGLLWHRDELKGLFDDMGQYNKSGEDSDLLTIYDNGGIIRNTKSEGLTNVDNVWLSVYGTTQPRVLKALFGNTVMLDKGLVPRFTWFYPTTEMFKDYSKSRTPRSEIMDQWDEFITKIYQGHFEDGTIAFDKNVRPILDVFRNEVNYYQGYEATVFGKLHILVYKLAGIAALARYADGDEAYGLLITADDMYWAINCAYYFRHTAMMVQSDCYGKQEDKTKEEVLGDLYKLYPKLNQSQLARSLGVSKQYVNKAVSTRSDTDKKSR